MNHDDPDPDPQQPQPDNVVEFPRPASARDPYEVLVAVRDGIDGIGAYLRDRVVRDDELAEISSRLDALEAGLEPEPEPEPEPELEPNHPVAVAPGVYIVRASWWSRRSWIERVGIIMGIIAVGFYATCLVRRVLRAVAELDVRLRQYDLALVDVRGGTMRVLAGTEALARQMRSLPGAVAAARPTTVHEHHQHTYDQRTVHETTHEHHQHDHHHHHSHTPERVVQVPVDRIVQVPVQRIVDRQPIIRPTVHTREVVRGGEETSCRSRKRGSLLQRAIAESKLKRRA